VNLIADLYDQACAAAGYTTPDIARDAISDSLRSITHPDPLTAIAHARNVGNRYWVLFDTERPLDILHTVLNNALRGHLHERLIWAEHTAGQPWQVVHIGRTPDGEFGGTRASALFSIAVTYYDLICVAPACISTATLVGTGHLIGSAAVGPIAAHPAVSSPEWMRSVGYLILDMEESDDHIADLWNTGRALQLGT
jgi:hypothetical protein